MATPRKTAASQQLKQHLGIPAGRLLELQQETLLPQPYTITDPLVVTPPTKARVDKMAEAQMSLMIYNSMLKEAFAAPNTYPAWP